MPTLRRAHTAAGVLLALVVVALCVPAMVLAAAQPRLIVGFAPEATDASRTDTLGRAGLHGTKSTSIRPLRAVIVPVAPGQLRATRARLLARPGVAYVEVDHVAHAYDLADAAASGVAAQWHPNDTFLSQQWALATLRAEEAWELSRGTGVTIAVVDTGVDYIHPDLAGHVDLGRDFVDGDDDPMDVQGHGTHVAGIAAGAADDGFGIAGIAPGSRILAVRVLDAKGAGNYSQVASGIVYAAQKGAKVINLSLGGPEQSELLRSAIDYAASRGAIVTCASGNESATSIGYPARYESCTAVGATDAADARAPFSNQGAGLDLVAPGAQIMSSTMGGLHESWDGTSMASPYVAGTAALLVSQGLGRHAVVDALTTTAKDVGAPGYDTATGAGRIDAAAAVQAGSRAPRAASDTVAPTVASIAIGAPARGATSKVTTRWKVVKRTGFVRVGTSDFLGSHSYNRTRTRGTTRVVETFRFRGGVVYRSTVTQKLVRETTRSKTATLPIAVTASDDGGVDRVAVQVDGRVQGVDWSAGEGWTIQVPCVAGAHTITAFAYDASDNEGSTAITQRVSC
ncbi:MAG: peptidase [Thermoleophilia bacterium]|nr:peptidase [Thermoleophilia bacterium]